jgi:hypothetical protein
LIGRVLLLVVHALRWLVRNRMPHASGVGMEAPARTIQRAFATRRCGADKTLARVMVSAHGALVCEQFTQNPTTDYSCWDSYGCPAGASSVYCSSHCVKGGQTCPSYHAPPNNPVADYPWSVRCVATPLPCATLICCRKQALLCQQVRQHIHASV